MHRGQGSVRRSWSSELELESGGLGVSSQESVRSSWSLELELECGGSNWESTTLAPAYAARPKASVDIPSWRLFAWVY